jgi:hypothetical protein
MHSCKHNSNVLHMSLRCPEPSTAMAQSLQCKRTTLHCMLSPLLPLWLLDTSRQAPIEHILKKWHLLINTQNFKYSAFRHTAANNRSLYRKLTSMNNVTFGPINGPACPESGAPISPMHSGAQDSLLRFMRQPPQQQQLQLILNIKHLTS